jgi:signal transduction histidine kinase
VVDNLLSNAIKFTPQDGSVTLCLQQEGDHVVLSVSDTGIGISEEEQARLFERFFRTSSATEAAIPGIGLGLSIVKAIVQAHGGEVTVTSATGAGTRFTVRLPRRLSESRGQPAEPGGTEPLCPITSPRG